MQNYNVSVIAYSGSKSTDLSDFVEVITLTQSIDSIEPIFSIEFLISGLQAINFSIDKIDITVSGYSLSKTVSTNNTYTLFPTSYPANTFSTENQSYPNTNTKKLSFRSGNCYSSLSSNVKETSQFNISLSNLLNTIKPNNTNFNTTPNIDQTQIQQIFIPSQSFIGALNYIDKWYSFYPGAHKLTCYPDQNGNTIINLRDYNYLSKNNIYDFSVFALLPMQSDTDYSTQLNQQYSGSNVYVTPIPIVFSSSLPSTMTTSNYNVTSIPFKTISSNTSLNMSSFINTYGIISGTYNPDSENVSNTINNSAQIKNHYTGYDKSISPFTSSEAMRFSRSVSATIQISLVPNFGSVWAGNSFNLIINDTTSNSKGGIYIVDSVIYYLSCQQSQSWDCSLMIKGIRSNLNSV